MIAAETTAILDPLDVMRAVGAAVWRPREEVSMSAWCAENVRLSPELEATSGNFNLEDNPFWADIIDVFLDPFVRQISVKKSTQIGGTLTLIAVAWALSEFDPAPMMIVGPDEVYCNELKERIYANGEESPKLRSRVPPERLRNSRHVDFSTCRARTWLGREVLSGYVEGRANASFAAKSTSTRRIHPRAETRSRPPTTVSNDSTIRPSMMSRRRGVMIRRSTSSTTRAIVPGGCVNAQRVASDRNYGSLCSKTANAPAMAVLQA